MKTELRNVIDSVIRENADGYKIYVGCDLTDNEQDQLINNIIKFDYEYVKDILLDRAQELIDERVGFVEAEDNYEAGLRPVVDQINGEVTWHRGY